SERIGVAMKHGLRLILAFSFLTTWASGQGLINFNNRVTSGSGPQAPVVAPVFVIGAGDEWPKYGNPASYPETPIPAGTQTYYGSPAVGTGFTAQLWAAKSTDPDSALMPIATTTFRVTTTP